jgi:hypothetical protein
MRSIMAVGRFEGQIWRNRMVESIPKVRKTSTRFLLSYATYSKATSSVESTLSVVSAALTPIALKWRKPPSKVDRSNNEPTTHALTSQRVAHASTITSIAKADIDPGRVSRLPVAAEKATAFDSSALNRLTDEVIGRIERRLRIDRERQGL